MLEKTKEIYKYWQQITNNLPKPFRLGLGGRIENLFIDILELEFLAQFSKVVEKEPFLKKCIVKFDILKFLMQISWENNHIKEKQFIHISKKFEVVGKELAGWKKFIETKTPARNQTGEIK